MIKQKFFVFHVILFFCVVFILVGTVKLFTVFLVYGRGLHLKEIDPAYYGKLVKKDPSYQFSKEFYRYHPHFGWCQTPNNEGWFRGFSYPNAEFRVPVKINSQGFHSSKEFAPDENKIRIAVLGDSFVQALQVKEEQNVVSLLEKNLFLKGVNAQVFNFGISNTGTAHQYRIFQEAVLKIKPQIVLLLFFPNDLIDDSPFYSHEYPFLTPAYALKSDGNVEVLDFMTRKPPYTVHYEFRQQEEKRNKIRLTNDFLFAKLFKLLLKDHLPHADYEAAFDVYKKNYPPELTDSMAMTVNLLKQIQDSCLANETKFYVVLIPAKEQFEVKAWDYYLRLRSHILDKEQFALTTPQNRIKEALAPISIPVLDLLPLFQKGYPRTTLYYREDMHFNPQGHQAAADEIAEFLYRTAF